MQLKELNMRPEEDGRVIIPAEVLEAIGTNADGTVYIWRKKIAAGRRCS